MMRALRARVTALIRAESYSVSADERLKFQSRKASPIFHIERPAVVDRAWANQKGLEPMARLVANSVGAVEPGMFGLGPVPAVKRALDRAGWKTGDIQRIEINEAFAAFAIAVTKDLGFPADVVNVEGGRAVSAARGCAQDAEPRRPEEAVPGGDVA
jgi:acetyl-CoA acetyltransferase